MNDKAEVLEKFDSVKLIDIAKNYRQYGYEEAIHQTATRILESRGIGELEIQFTGYEKTSRFEAAQKILKTFGRSSKLAFILYASVLVVQIFSAYTIAKFPASEVVMVVFNLLVTLSFIIAEIKAFIDWKDFYQSIGRSPNTDDQLVFFVIGMPLYIFFYFYYRGKMKEDITFIE